MCSLCAGSRYGIAPAPCAGSTGHFRRPPPLQAVLRSLNGLTAGSDPRYMSKRDKLLHANPPETDVLAEGDRVVALARTSARPTLWPE